MKEKLTPFVVEKTSAPVTGRLEIHDTDVKGLSVRITSNNVRTYAVRTRVKGSKKQIRIKIGDVGEIGLKEARDRAWREIANARGGIDRREEKRQASVAAERATERATKLQFENVLSDFLDKHFDGVLDERSAPKYAKEVRSVFEHHVTPHFEGKLINEITKSDIVDMLDGVPKKVAERKKKAFLERQRKNELTKKDLLPHSKKAGPHRTNRVLAAVRKLFNWAVARGILTVSPVSTDMKRDGEKSRDRVLTFDELRIFWRATDRLAEPWGSYFKTLLLTGQRRGEVAAMRWDGLDMEASFWHLAASETKADRKHIVPLSDAVRDILRARPNMGEFVFTTRDNAPISGFAKIVSDLDDHIQDICKEDGREPIKEWRIHDLRRSFSTIANDAIGIQDSIISGILNHARKTRLGVSSVYMHGQELFPKRKALNAWSRLVALIADNELCAKVSAILSPKSDEEATRTDEFRRLIMADAPAWAAYVEGLRRGDADKVVRLEKASA